MKAIYNNKYERLAFFGHHEESGVQFFDDRLSTNIDSGLYTLEFKVYKTHDTVKNLREGNYIETFTRNGKQLLLQIVSVTENRNEITVLCEDTTIQVLNGYVEEVDEPNTPEMISYYANHALEKTVIELKAMEVSDTQKLGFSSPQRVLERLREIAKAFGAELSFDIEFKVGRPPKRYVSFLKRRYEGADGFRLTSDNLLMDIERDINILNVVTKMEVRGASITEGSTGSSTTAPSAGVSATQPKPTIYKDMAGGATSPISTSGYSEAFVNQYRIDQADPPYVTGDYIDSFLRRGYPDSPIIGYGKDVKELADYYGIAVGAFLGVAAKETVFGRSASGGIYNFTGITSGSGTMFDGVLPKKYAVDRYWIDPQDVRTGIAAFFHLARWGYVEQGYANYASFAERWAPAYENDHRSVKSLFYGVMMAFGYDPADTKSKTNYSKRTDNVSNVMTSTVVPSPDTQPSRPQVDSIAEKVIAEAERIAALRLPYQWGGNGNPSYDCSGFVQQCYKAAGLNPASAQWPRSTTYSMWAQDGRYRKITRDQLKRGDLIMYDTGYTTPGDVNHVGIYLGPTLSSPNSVIHSGNPCGIKQRADSMKIIGFVTVQR